MPEVRFWKQKSKAELRKQCTDRRLETSGTHAQLCERLAFATAPLKTKPVPVKTKSQKTLGMYFNAAVKKRTAGRPPKRPSTAGRPSSAAATSPLWSSKVKGDGTMSPRTSTATPRTGQKVRKQAATNVKTRMNWDVGAGKVKMDAAVRDWEDETGKWLELQAASKNPLAKPSLRDYSKHVGVSFTPLQRRTTGAAAAGGIIGEAGVDRAARGSGELLTLTSNQV